MSNGLSLDQRILQAYPELGLSTGGIWVGSQKFKKQCVSRFANEAPELLVRQSINALVMSNRIPYTVKQTPKSTPRAPPPKANPNLTPPNPLRPTITFESWVASKVDEHRGQPPFKSTTPGVNSLVRRISEEVPQCYSKSDTNQLRGIIERIISRSTPQPRPATTALPKADKKVEVAKLPVLDDQLCLLSLQEDKAVDINDIERAVLFTPDLLENNQELLPQFGLVGGIMPGGSEPQADDPRVFLNTNHPCSFFICGLQGSGKSHSTSTLLENFLIRCPILGHLQQPLSGLVFHYGQFTSHDAFRPCEAAFIARANSTFEGKFGLVPVTVLVSPSNFQSLNASYSSIRGVKVRHLRIHPKRLNVRLLLSLMSVQQSSNTPLYLAQVTMILREMAIDSPTLDYTVFKRRLDELELSPMQRSPLDQRLNLLESFLDLSSQPEDSSLGFAPGSLMIVDLSCPFVDANTACVLFEMCLVLFLGDPAGSATGKIIALDEAHKYMMNTPASKSLTESLVATIRQQRHYGARIIVSTQEPTVDQRLIDLSTVTLIHRFTSPEWFGSLCKHVSITGNHDDADRELLKRIGRLGIGEALVYAPTAICHGEKLESRLIRVKIRKRVTWDGGKSVTST